MFFGSIDVVPWKHQLTKFDKALSTGAASSEFIFSIEPKLSGFDVEPHFMMQNILLKHRF